MKKIIELAAGLVLLSTCAFAQFEADLVSAMKDPNDPLGAAAQGVGGSIEKQNADMKALAKSNASRIGKITGTCGKGVLNRDWTINYGDNAVQLRLTSGPLGSKIEEYMHECIRFVFDCPFDRWVWYKYDNERAVAEVLDKVEAHTTLIGPNQCVYEEPKKLK